jgi:hypothetical protein
MPSRYSLRRCTFRRFDTFVATDCPDGTRKYGISTRETHARPSSFHVPITPIYYSAFTAACGNVIANVRTDGLEEGGFSLKIISGDIYVFDQGLPTLVMGPWGGRLKVGLGKWEIGTGEL